MAVLVECISVIVRRQSIDETYPGGWNDFLTAVPNGTLCTDGELVRVGFMHSRDVEAYVGALGDSGLRFVVDGAAVDVVVVDQQRGPTVRCDWVTFGRANLPGLSVSVAECRRVGSTLRGVALPEGWAFEGSLSQRFQFAPSEGFESQMKFLRHENGIDIYVDLASGKEVYNSRTSS